MNLGAMIDLGVDIDFLNSELKKLQVGGYEIKVQKAIKKGIEGTKAEVLLESEKNKETAKVKFNPQNFKVVTGAHHHPIMLIEPADWAATRLARHTERHDPIQRGDEVADDVGLARTQCDRDRKSATEPVISGESLRRGRQLGGAATSVGWPYQAVANLAGIPGTGTALVRTLV